MWQWARHYSNGCCQKIIISHPWPSASDTYFTFGQLSPHCSSSSILTCWTWLPLFCSPFSANCANCCFKTPNDYDNCTTCWMTMTIVGVSGKELAPGTVELYDRVQFTLWLSTFLSGRRQLASCGHIDARVRSFQGLIYLWPIACDCLAGEIKAATVVASNGQAFEN